MNTTDEINNEEKRVCHHNLRKNRKPRSYDFEYYEESLNKPRGKKRGRKRGRKPKNVLYAINKNLNTTNVVRVKRPYIRRKPKGNNVCANDDIEKNKSNDYLLEKYDNPLEKTTNVEQVRTKGRKRKNFNIDKNMHLFNSNVPLRNNNIKIDIICDFLSYKTNTTWKYMGSTVKFRLINDQQEKYIFLKNMKKHIIFEIIKIAMFALLKVNLNDNNIYTLHLPGKKKQSQEDYTNQMNFSTSNRRCLNENNIDSGTYRSNANNGKNNSSEMSNNSEKNNRNKKKSNSEGTNMVHSKSNFCNNLNNNNSNSYYSYHFPNKDRANNNNSNNNNRNNNYSHHSSENNYYRNKENLLKNDLSEEKANFNLKSSYYYDALIDINKRLEEKNDILNQGVTVSEILDFVKEKYEKYYENVKQYIVSTLNIYCALNIFKLIRRGRYAICRYDNFNIFKVKYFKKYYKFFYNLKGEEEILMNVKNYLKSFYYDKTQNEPNTIMSNENVRNNVHFKVNKMNEEGNNKMNQEKQKFKQKKKKHSDEFETSTHKDILSEQEYVITNDKIVTFENKLNVKDEKGSNGKHENDANDIFEANRDDSTKMELKNSYIFSFNNIKMNEEYKECGQEKTRALCEVSNDDPQKQNEECEQNEELNVIVTNNMNKYVNEDLEDYYDGKIKNVFIDLNKINIKCIKVVYGMKHFFCSYDTKETNDENFEIIKVQKKYDVFRRSNLVNMNLRYNFLYNSKRLFNYNTDDNNNNNSNANNGEYTLNSTKNVILRSSNNVNMSKDEQTQKQPQYGKQKKKNNEDDITRHEKYNYINFNLGYKTLRKKMICIRHYISTNKREEKVLKPKIESKVKDKPPAISNDSLMKTCSINSNLSNVVSVDGLSSMNFESHCSQ
ncbi:conserved Plasmodium protein, unknown function [Plasmodium malariae]|uniref:Asparagine-rich protein n=1 Tax=Plasmodium malariae TaxID=5858 RepID=A0A1C3KYA0_PLAMA|nr:conserved Plasmodium protein, unknown function [Plasmodium malariae]